MQTYQHIVAAISLIEEADVIAERALALAQGNQAKLTILHVVEDLPLDPTGDSLLVASVTVDPDVIARARVALNDYCAQLAYPVEAVTELGSIQAELLRFIEQNHCDLVVIGSHRRTGLSALFGGKEDSIFHRASCDVLAVRI